MCKIESANFIKTWDIGYLPFVFVFIYTGRNDVSLLFSLDFFEAGRLYTLIERSFLYFT